MCVQPCPLSCPQELDDTSTYTHTHRYRCRRRHYSEGLLITNDGRNLFLLFLRLCYFTLLACKPDIRQNRIIGFLNLILVERYIIN